ncbi:DUF2155 domain-containing protein [Sphingomonas sp. CA1-15]|uniref:DUF2155 domain-containing protein n=1 Tax=Sphingomonas immobilis TaxID=3063997 RepID=A0ABT8ZWU6_9SPHN|nr:DUF2155 domain-containing protein [Sphingomonas sp. CA1-15]MDO7842036.1 DUF2155 domain-containing protein [Sphingomonas sp. CA1-15]
MGGCDKGGAPKPAPTEATPRTALDEEGGPSDVVTVDVNHDDDPSFGATPMAQRVAVLGLLNKRNGVAREVTLKPGQAVRVGDAIVRLRACEQTAPWEQDHYTGAFVQLDVRGLDDKWRRFFSGWIYKERPSLNVVQHPIYDVWTKSCAMTFPEGGPNSVSAGDDKSAKRSSAKKSGDEGDDTPEPSTPTPSNAADNTVR